MHRQRSKLFFFSDWSGNWVSWKEHWIEIRSYSFKTLPVTYWENLGKLLDFSESPSALFENKDIT